MQNQVLQSLPVLIPFLEEGTSGEIYKSSTSQRSYFWSKGWEGGRARGGVGAVAKYRLWRQIVLPAGLNLSWSVSEESQDNTL